MKTLIALILLIFLTGCASNGTSEIEYTPMQCQIEPWDSWYAQSDIRFVQEPTSEQLIVLYYSEVYGIELEEVHMLTINDVTCEACDVCPKGFKFIATVEEESYDKMLELDWQPLEG